LAIPRNEHSTITAPGNFIAGRWTPAENETRIDVVNPTTEEVIGSVAASTSADVNRAVDAAACAFEGWSSTSVDYRVAMLRRIGAALVERADSLATLITREVGSPFSFSQSTQVGLPINVTEGVAASVAEAVRDEPIGTSLVVRDPVGVVAAITPWNYPLHQVMAKVSAALGAGCTIVIKPSVVAPLSALVLAEIFEQVDLPPGVGNIVTGAGRVVGEALTSHPAVDAVSLTGSPAAGQRVMELAAPLAKRVTLELGGKSASIVLDDVDIEGLIPGCVAQCFRNAGQNCSALSRLLVPRSWLTRVEEIAAETGEALLVGDPFDPATQMGPLVSASQREQVRGYIELGMDEGATIICGGVDAPHGLDRGFFVRPTVFSAVDPDMRNAQEEIFGPVLCLLPYDTEEDAIAIANNSRFGLAGAVWSADDQRAQRVARKMRTGRVVVNGGAFNPVAPFGGYRQSGVGREFGRYGLEEYLEVKTLQL
jgi:acyl-CoA reductase-like NAD-dependent aldehyde dehydrogenase